jgi:prepilin-type N-terminal cleavage/methylation domain-containing protein
MRRNAKGFTVIEVLVAVTVMAIALTGIAAMSVSTISTDTLGRRTNAATALAQAKLEELRILRRSDPDWDEGTHTETGLKEDGSSGGGLYDREWVIDENYNGLNSLSRVVVTVSWLDGQVSLASLYW